MSKKVLQGAALVLLVVATVLTTLAVQKYLDNREIRQGLDKIKPLIAGSLDGNNIRLEALCREALKLEPDNCDHWAHLGYALHFQARHKEAVKCYEKAIALEPKIGSSVVWENRSLLVRSYMVTGEKEKAIEQIKYIAEHIDKYKEKDQLIMIGMLIDYEE